MIVSFMSDSKFEIRNSRLNAKISKFEERYFPKEISNPPDISSMFNLLEMVPAR